MMIGESEEAGERKLRDRRGERSKRRRNRGGVWGKEKKDGCGTRGKGKERMKDRAKKTRRNVVVCRIGSGETGDRKRRKENVVEDGKKRGEYWKGTENIEDMNEMNEWKGGLRITMGRRNRVETNKRGR